MSSEQSEPVYTLHNTARLLKNEKRTVVEIRIETDIQGEKALQVLLSRCLRAASEAEFQTCFMSEEAIESFLRERNIIDKINQPSRGSGRTAMATWMIP